MTRVYDDGIGAKKFTSNKPADVTYPTVLASNQVNGPMITEVVFEQISTTSADAILEFVAPDNGKIAHITLVNGSVACDGSSGLELSFINKTNSDDVLAYVGFGSGTEAAKATDKDTAVAADEVASVAVSDTSRFNKGDKVSCTVDRDGTTVVGTIVVGLELSAVGR